jgi:hypothetical protein
MTEPGRSVRVIGLALLLAATMAAAVPPPPPAAASAQATAGRKAPSFLLNATFFGVSAFSARNAWAVGQFQSGSVNRTLIAHWNGFSWRQVPSPNPAPARDSDSLNGVAATSATSAWAVGEQNGHSLLLRWNGKVWRPVRSPDIGNLAGVAATSATNAWAVGIGGAKGTLTAIEHWNGKTWQVVPSPVKVGNLQAVAVSSATNAWAVGFSGPSANSRALAEHWNGKAWKVVHSPDPAGAGTLLGVATTSADNAWAVSGATQLAFLTFASVINHWNGRAWTRVASPDPVPGGAILLGAGASSASDAWAVGADWVFVDGPHNVIAHWNGKAWKLVPSPILDGQLFAVTARSATDAWAVGSGDTGAIIEHWNGARWSGTTFGS